MTNKYNMIRVIFGIIILMGIMIFLRKEMAFKSPKTRLMPIQVKRKLQVHPSVLVLDTKIQDTELKAPNTYCVPLKLDRFSITFCAYSPEKDNALHYFLKSKYSEETFVLRIMKVLEKDSRFQFVDLGANLGTYTLPMAHIKRNVLAVEPSFETVRRLKKAIYMGNMSQYVTVLYNAMSDGHETLSLGQQLKHAANTYLLKSINCTETDPNRCVSSTVNTITMDDLIPLMTSDRAIIKVDIQGSEIKAFNTVTASKFFDAIQVPYIFLEWQFYNDFYNDINKRATVDEWLKFFYSRNYTVHHEGTEAVLGKDWQHWPLNVIFKKPYESIGLL